MEFMHFNQIIGLIFSTGDVDMLRDNDVHNNTISDGKMTAAEAGSFGANSRS